MKTAGRSHDVAAQNGNPEAPDRGFAIFSSVGAPHTSCGRVGADMAALQPAEGPAISGARRPGALPAQHFYVRHARNVEFSGVELATIAADARPAFWLGDVGGADLNRIKLPPSRTTSVMLSDVSGFRARPEAAISGTSRSSRRYRASSVSLL